MIDWSMVLLTFAASLAGVLVVVVVVRLARPSRSFEWPVVLAFPVSAAIAEIIQSQWSLSGSKQMVASGATAMVCLAIAYLIVHKRRQVR